MIPAPPECAKKKGAATMREVIYTKAVQRQVDRLGRQVRELEDRMEALRRRIEQVKCGESPIQPGDLITWESGSQGRPRRGRVLTVGTTYGGGYECRCEILSKGGRPIGFAVVRTDQLPTLEGSG
jgi:hypothetical protein